MGGLVTFDVAMHYDDDFGHLGDRTLHFAPAPGSPGLFGTATGPSALALPPRVGEMTAGARIALLAAK